MALSADILRGYTDTIILHQLSHGDSYGYQINKTISTLSGGEVELKEATLYTAFRRLEAAGLPVVFHVHDEVVIDVAPWDTEDAMLGTVCSIMGEPVPWAPDLPLKAAGWVGYYFTKD